MPEKVIIGNAELWCGDCLDVLPSLSKNISIISDPPYGIDFQHGGHLGKAYAGEKTKSNNSRIHGDDEPFDPAHLLRFHQQILFGADHYAQRLPHGRWLVWDKLDGLSSWDSFSDVEMAWHSAPGAARIFRLVWKGMCQGAGKDKGTKRTHPTQKPVALMEWCIAQAGRPFVVCDPYMGTGATGVAAINMGLKFIGIEIHRPYFDSACERIDRAQSQGVLVLDDPNLKPDQQALGLR